MYETPWSCSCCSAWPLILPWVQHAHRSPSLHTCSCDPRARAYPVSCALCRGQLFCLFAQPATLKEKGRENSVTGTHCVPGPVRHAPQSAHSVDNPTVSAAGVSVLHAGLEKKQEVWRARGFQSQSSAPGSQCSREQTRAPGLPCGARPIDLHLPRHFVGPRAIGWLLCQAATSVCYTAPAQPHHLHHQIPLGLLWAGIR